jgi:hypothetical protein
MSRPDVWLRGPVDGVPAMLQPAAHAFLQALEDVDLVVGDLAPDELWRKPGGAASIGFHLKHMAGATDRLLTYARGEPLNELQRTWLTAEANDGPSILTPADLAAQVRGAIEAGLAQLAATPPDSLLTPRSIGRAQLPTTVLGCLFHAAEHAARHAGQLITTMKAIR